MNIILSESNIDRDSSTCTNVGLIGICVPSKEVLFWAIYTNKKSLDLLDKVEVPMGSSRVLYVSPPSPSPQPISMLPWPPLPVIKSFTIATTAFYHTNLYKKVGNRIGKGSVLDATVKKIQELIEWKNSIQRAKVTRVRLCVWCSVSYAKECAVQLL